MNINEFIEEFCKNCKEICDKGIVEKKDFIRCVDKDIFISKNTFKKNKSN